jgi:hypothetical protein
VALIIAVVAPTAETEDRIAEKAGAELLLAAVRQHQDFEAGQRSCLAALRNLVCSGTQGSDEHNIAWVLMTFRVQHHRVRQATNTCFVAYLKWLLDDSRAAEKSKLMAATTVQPIVEAISRHLDSAALVEAGIATLSNLATRDGPCNCSRTASALTSCRVPCRHTRSETPCLLPLADFSEEIVSRCNGVQCVIDAMKRHESEVAVQVTGCIALHNFTTSSGVWRH